MLKLSSLKKKRYFGTLLSAGLVHETTSRKISNPIRKRAGDPFDCSPRQGSTLIASRFFQCEIARLPRGAGGGGKRSRWEFSSGKRSGQPRRSSFPPYSNVYHSSRRSRLSSGWQKIAVYSFRSLLSPSFPPPLLRSFFFYFVKTRTIRAGT